MAVFQNAQELVRNTPLVRLQQLGLPSSIQLYAKLELQNPAGGVKDRMGIYLIAKLLAEGALHKDSVIIEATAGNTGLGLALGALNTNIPLIFTIPSKFSTEKQTLLRAMGATIINTPAEEGMLGAAQKAEELRQQIPHAITIKQFENQYNPLAHYETTAPEIYHDLNGNIRYFVAGAGTGGTYSGIARYLKEKIPALQGVLADPHGSTLGGGTSHAPYRIEGIGNDFVPKTMDLSLVDQVIKVTDEEAFAAVRLLARKEGLFAGSSSGANLAAALKLAATIKEGVIVTIFSDRAERYFSKHLLDDEN